jgi:UDP-glucose:(heptosyl)LPS alpha-1,3-glucosyltransferase
MPHPDPPVQPAADRTIFVRQQFSQFGGAELILDRLLAALTARGKRVALLGRSWRGGRDVEFIRCDPPKLTRALRETLFARAACRLIARERGALVQAHERVPCCDIFRAGDGVHAAYLEQKQRTQTAFGRLTDRLSLFHRNTLTLERKLFASPRLQAAIVNSEMVADDIVRHFGFPRERIHLVPNGIDLTRFRLQARDEHRATIRARLGVPATKPVALFVGSGFERKGLRAAIHAAAAYGDAELWAIGHDRRPAHFVAEAERAGLGKRFRLIGPTDPLPYYAAADALILPSFYDPFPSTVIEALACGLPVVTTTGCGARDVVKRLDARLVRDALDREGLVEALRAAFDLAAKPDTAARARTITEEFGIDAMVDRMIVLYDRLAAARQGKVQG